MSRYIDADALYNDICFSIDQMTDAGIAVDAEYLWGKLNDALDNAPSIDIVRCQDCKHWVYNFNGCARNPCTEPWYALDFCNYGERREP